MSSGWLCARNEQLCVIARPDPGVLPDPYVRWTYDAVGNRLTEKRGAASGATSTTLTYNNAD